MRKIFLFIAAVGFLTACDTTVLSGIAATETALTGAETTAKEYIALPACADNGPIVCSDAAIITKIKTADQIAYDAVVNAQTAAQAADATDSNVEKAEVAAQAAVAEFVNLIATLKVK
jgi:hypothetical protein